MLSFILAMSLWTTPQIPTGLHAAARANDLEALNRALTLGAKIDARDDQGWTALHTAVSANAEQAVKWLIAHGAPVSARADDGTTPLMSAASNGSTAAARLLLDSGADRLSTAPSGLTAFDIADAFGHEELVKLLTVSPPAHNELVMSKTIFSAPRPKGFGASLPNMRARPVLTISPAAELIFTINPLRPLPGREFVVECRFVNRSINDRSLKRLSTKEAVGDQMAERDVLALAKFARANAETVILRRAATWTGAHDERWMLGVQVELSDGSIYVRTASFR